MGCGAKTNRQQQQQPVSVLVRGPPSPLGPGNVVSNRHRQYSWKGQHTHTHKLSFQLDVIFRDELSVVPTCKTLNVSQLLLVLLCPTWLQHCLCPVQASAGDPIEVIT